MIQLTRHLLGLSLALVVVLGLGCRGCIHGVGKIYAWNGTDKTVQVVFEGRSDADLTLRPNTGDLLEEQVAGSYTAKVVHEDGTEQKAVFDLKAEKLSLLNVDGRSCFARVDIAGFYKPGKDRNRLVEAYPGQDVHELDDVIAVYPGQEVPPTRPKGGFAFLRLVPIPCEMVADPGAIQEYLRKSK